MGFGFGWGWLDMRSGRQGAGRSDRVGPQNLRKTGQDLVSEFGARGRQGSVRRWGGLGGLRKWRVVSGE